MSGSNSALNLWTRWDDMSRIGQDTFASDMSAVLRKYGAALREMEVRFQIFD